MCFSAVLVAPSSGMSPSERIKTAVSTAQMDLPAGYAAATKTDQLKTPPLLSNTYKWCNQGHENAQDKKHPFQEIYTTMTSRCLMSQEHFLAHVYPPVFKFM